MSTLLKKLHVHFEDDVVSESGQTKTVLDDELATRNRLPTIRNYTRDQLLEYGRSKAAKEPPKMFDLSGADDKRKEKIRCVLKNSDIWKTWNLKNGVSDGTVASKDGVAATDSQARTNFQQMISAAVSNAQQQNMDYSANRRRIGSGRILEKQYTYDVAWRDSMFAKQNTEIDNTDAKSDEPEWANCGPISKHDVIELHGFDGPEDDGTEKSESTASVSPPARSTPSKVGAKKPMKSDEHFNFDEFLKLDLPPSVNCSREPTNGESRFSQWFGRDKLSHSNKFAGNAHESKATQQLFDYHQKMNQKKANAPNKLRSVNELEANWCPNQTKVTQPKTAQPTVDVNSIRMILNQLAASSMTEKQQRSMNAAQTNFLLGLINKGTENLYQYRLTQNAIMKRPDAQLLLHRLVNGEITQFHILQQISNPTLHQRDRETLLAVFAFCNENQQWLVQQQEQHIKHKEHMSQQFRQLQMQLKCGHLQQSPPIQPTQEAIQFHTRAIMQNALYKKQIEDQYRTLQNLKTGNQTKSQSYKSNNFMNNQQFNRYNHKQNQNFGQNGLQFIQSQNKASWNRHNSANASSSSFMGGTWAGPRNTNDLFPATMPSFAKFDTATMASGKTDKVPIAVEK